MNSVWERLWSLTTRRPNFDPDFYRAYYADLHAFKSPRALRRHYLRHGKAEGRFSTLAAARSHFERINGPTPADFDVGLYQQLNPDLANVLSGTIQYELHFLKHGRFEDRPYKGVSSQSKHSWQALLNIYDFNLLNEGWLPEGGVDRAEAIALMEKDGAARLAPISQAWVFDAAFYAMRYGIEGDEVALYRDWLHVGFPLGRAPNEVRGIFGLMGGKPYPEEF